MFNTDLRDNIAHTNNSGNEDPEWIQIDLNLKESYQK